MLVRVGFYATTTPCPFAQPSGGGAITRHHLCTSQHDESRTDLYLLLQCHSAFGQAMLRFPRIELTTDGSVLPMKALAKPPSPFTRPLPTCDEPLPGEWRSGSRK